MKTNDEKTFNYNYSSDEQAEIKKIREKYLTPDQKEPDKLQRLKSLDASVNKKANIVSMTVGIIGVLILGFGMSLLMSDLSSILGELSDMNILIGSLIGVIGIILICFAYPIYKRVLKTERAKVAPEILSLTDELIK